MVVTAVCSNIDIIDYYSQSMTVMYPLTTQNNYTELKYSLRSIEKFLSEPYEIVIVAERLPQWLCNVTWINLPDVPGRKQLSIRRKILAALEYTDEILFMNDDVYLLRPPELKYYYQADLKNHTSEAGAKILAGQLTEMDKPTKDFDGHYPLVYKQNFKEVSEQFTADCIIKSMYCNYWNIEGEQIKDCKLINAKSVPDLTLPAISTGPFSLKIATPMLQYLFPLPSSHEL